MFNINYNDLKKSKKEYSNILKHTNINSYRLHEKISMLNHSIQSNCSETTASKSNTTKSLCPTYRKLSVNDKKPLAKKKKCSYIDFLELRKTKNSYPLGNNEKRFKWQNLKDENIVIYPEIYKKPHKKQYLLKETFGEEILGLTNNRQELDKKPKTRRLRRCHSDNIGDDFEITKRVILPECNKEKPKICKRKAFSQHSKIFHKTSGNIKSLFELTPVDIPVKGKKLYKNRSFYSLAVNIFDDDYGKYEIPIHTKKHYFNNLCYYDHIKDQNLISDMNKCWKVKKIKRSRSFDNQEFKTGIEFHCNRNINNLHLRNMRNFDKSYINKTETNKSLSKIKRKKKKMKYNI